MSIKFDDFVEGKSAGDVGIGAFRMDGLVRAFGDSIQEPIDFLFFGWWIHGVVVCHLGAQFFEEIDVGTNVGAVDMA